MNDARWPLWPGLLIGAAMAGLFDGVVFHQILQWHHMICIERHCVTKSVATMVRQNYYDGLFHAAMLALLTAGLVGTGLAAQRDRYSRRRFWGAFGLGFGLFNVVEGLVDHHFLEIHHVRFGPGQPAWDVGFLIAGLAIAIAGGMVARRPRLERLLEAG